MFGVGIKSERMKKKDDVDDDVDVCERWSPTEKRGKEPLLLKTKNEKSTNLVTKMKKTTIHIPIPILILILISILILKWRQKEKEAEKKKRKKMKMRIRLVKLIENMNR